MITIGKQTNRVTTAVVPAVEIRWPSGKRQTLEQIPADRTITVREP